MAYQSFENLEIWKRASRLAVRVYSLTGEWKPYSLRDQMQRAALSIPSNIAEGSERDSRKDFIRFLRIAKGSAAEQRTQSYIASKLKIMTKLEADEVIGECKELSAMIFGLIRSLEDVATEN